jgi:hypothetical protein
LAGSELNRLNVENKTAIDMADDNSARYQHHRGGDTAEDEADKSQSRTISHDALVSFLLIRRRNRAKGSAWLAINRSLAQPSRGIRARRSMPMPRHNIA